MRPLYAFSGQDSFLHHLDPRTKLIFVVSYLLLSFLVPQPWILFLVLIAVIWGLARISPAEYYQFLLLMLPIIVAIILVHTVLIGGPAHLRCAGPGGRFLCGPLPRVGHRVGSRLR